MSTRDALEMVEFEKFVLFNAEVQRVEVDYPLIKDPYMLTDNSRS